MDLLHLFIESAQGMCVGKAMVASVCEGHPVEALCSNMVAGNDGHIISNDASVCK